MADSREKIKPNYITESIFGVNMSLGNRVNFVLLGCPSVQNSSRERDIFIIQTAKSQYRSTQPRIRIKAYASSMHCNRTANDLIRLHGCTGWSGPSLFVYALSTNFRDLANFLQLLSFAFWYIKSGECAVRKPIVSFNPFTSLGAFSADDKLMVFFFIFFFFFFFQKIRIDISYKEQFAWNVNHIFLEK